jgi:hypothetical protein
LIVTFLAGASAVAGVVPDAGSAGLALPPANATPAPATSIAPTAIRIDLYAIADSLNRSPDRKITRSAPLRRTSALSVPTLSQKSRFRSPRRFCLYFAHLFVIVRDAQLLGNAGSLDTIIAHDYWQFRENLNVLLLPTFVQHCLLNVHRRHPRREDICGLFFLRIP